MQVRWGSVARTSLVLALLLAGAVAYPLVLPPHYVAAPQKTDQGFYFFGVATLNADSSVCLQMLSKEAEQPKIERYICFKPGDPDYAKVRKHIGPIAVGQEKEFGAFGE